jgi:nucleoside-triphosphatase THEP1
MDNNQVELQNDEMKDFLKHIISTNKIIQEEGKNNLSVEVIGESGLGKTSTVIQLADELNLNFVKLNLAQIEELGDLVGFPIRQFKMVKESGMTAEPKMKEVTEIVKKQVKMKKMVDGKLVDEVIVKEVPVKKMVPVERGIPFFRILFC